MNEQFQEIIKQFPKNSFLDVYVIDENKNETKYEFSEAVCFNSQRETILFLLFQSTHIKGYCRNSINFDAIRKSNIIKVENAQQLKQYHITEKIINYDNPKYLEIKLDCGLSICIHPSQHLESYFTKYFLIDKINWFFSCLNTTNFKLIIYRYSSTNQPEKIELKSFTPLTYNFTDFIKHQIISTYGDEGFSLTVKAPFLECTDFIEERIKIVEPDVKFDTYTHFKKWLYFTIKNPSQGYLTNADEYFLFPNE